MKQAVALLLAALLVFAGVVLGAAQEKKGKGVGDRVAGTIRLLNKDTKTITVRTSANIDRQVIYTADTKFTKQNEPGGSSDDLKDGTRIICVGKFNDKGQLMAERIDFRAPR